VHKLRMVSLRNTVNGHPVGAFSITTSSSGL
jgi:hypothetical protein